jgi:excisionase family DNA binding protein
MNEHPTTQTDYERQPAPDDTARTAFDVGQRNEARIAPSRSKARNELLNSTAAKAYPADPSAPEPPQKRAGGTPLNLLRPKEAAKLLKVSLSWLAKARMNGDGPPYIRVGRSIRYSEAALLQWLKSRQRLSTSEQ